MKKLSKRAQAFADKVVPGKHYSIPEAVEILEELSSKKFKESYDISINLGVDPKKSDQVVRGATVLPNGTGKSVRVAVFAQEIKRLKQRCWSRYCGYGRISRSSKKWRTKF